MLTRRDLGTILPQDGVRGDHDWLNDNTINAWFGALCMAKSEQAGYQRNSKTPPPIAAFNSAWWMNVTKAGKGVEGIKTWSRRQGVKGEKLLHAEKIFFPINTGAHWTLLVISGRDRTIEHLDSLSTPVSGKRERSIARAWLAMELEDRYLAEEWTDLDSSSARQPNLSDCGVFACFNGLAAVRGVDYGEVGSLRNKREKMAAVLINGGFSGLFGL
ncbi:cysteine proteinase [Polychaeton citri CBS 116435]|uniref:Cysteine proteinase n=1 Tax=Polychaeton citri CBS 116435 TaxID=1314669 RepID=A0A9P4QBH8_9PEZI|nr:cysteine proteinase [Polychaeton citri CBS 116435]